MSAESLLGALVWCMTQNFIATTVMIPVVAVACRAFRHRPAVQNLLWTIVLVKFLLPPLPMMAWRVPAVESLLQTRAKSSSVGSNEAGSFVPADARAIEADEIAAMRSELGARGRPLPTPTRSLIAMLFPAVIGTWMAGAIAVFVVQAARIRRLYCIVRSGAAATEQLAETVNSVARRMRVRSLKTIVVPRIASPFLCCLGRLRLVWPSPLADCRGDTVRAIIAHEIAHVRRRDHWVAWLEFGCLIVWWWNPLFWFAKNRLRSSMEMACDAMALAAFPDDRCLYAETLLWLSATLEIGALPLAMAVRGASPNSLERRLQMIVSIQASEKRPLLGVVAAVLLAAASIPSLTMAQTAEKGRSAGDPDDNVATRKVLEARVADESADVEKAVAKHAAVDRLNVEIDKLKAQQRALRENYEAAERAEAAAKNAAEKKSETKANRPDSSAIITGRDGKTVYIVFEHDGQKTKVDGEAIILRDGKIAEVHKEQVPVPGRATDPTAAKYNLLYNVSPPAKVPGQEYNVEYQTLHRLDDGTVQIERWVTRPGADPRLIEVAKLSPKLGEAFDKAVESGPAISPPSANAIEGSSGAIAHAAPRAFAEEKAVDLVSLATAYADAVAAAEVADDAAARHRADRKVLVLAKIAQLELDAASEECKRIEKLASMGVVSQREAKELQSRCAILQEILSMKPKAPANGGSSNRRSSIAPRVGTPSQVSAVPLDYSPPIPPTDIRAGTTPTNPEVGILPLTPATPKSTTDSPARP